MVCVPLISLRVQTVRFTSVPQNNMCASSRLCARFIYSFIAWHLVCAYDAIHTHAVIERYALHVLLLSVASTSNSMFLHARRCQWRLFLFFVFLLLLWTSNEKLKWRKTHKFQSGFSRIWKEVCKYRMLRFFRNSYTVRIQNMCIYGAKTPA